MLQKNKVFEETSHLEFYFTFLLNFCLNFNIMYIAAYLQHLKSDAFLKCYQKGITDGLCGKNEKINMEFSVKALGLTI